MRQFIDSLSEHCPIPRAIVLLLVAWNAGTAAQAESSTATASGSGVIIGRNSRAVNWNLKLVQFVSPRVWASRPGRAKQLAADYDLRLSIFTFEKDWYAKRAPKLRVEFVGHPIVDRMRGMADEKQKAEGKMLLLLPGSRKSELYRHLPVMLGALEYIKGQLPSVRAKMVLPSEQMKGLAAQADRAVWKFRWAVCRKRWRERI